MCPGSEAVKYRSEISRPLSPRESAGAPLLACHSSQGALVCPAVKRQSDFDPPTGVSLNRPAWAEELETDSFPSLEGDAEADVCVVGLGGSGLTCIHELLRLRQRVIGIDAVTVGGGAAGRNAGFLLAGIVAPYHNAVEILGRYRARRIHQLTLEELARIEAETPDVVDRRGSLRIADSDEEAADCALHRLALANDGFPVEPYEGPEGTGIYFPADGSFNPLVRCRILARRAAELGATLHEHSRAIALARGEVWTANGRIRCRQVIVAVDGALEIVLPELAGRVRTARLQMLSTDPEPATDLRYPVYRRWGFDYWQKLPDSRVVLGGCRDRFMESEWTTDSNTTDEVQRCMESVLRNVAQVTAPVRNRWAASVSYSNGVLPVMEEARPGVWAIGGYSGTGNVIGAIYGRMVAQLVVTGKSELRRVIEG